VSELLSVFPPIRTKHGQGKWVVFSLVRGCPGRQVRLQDSVTVILGRPFQQAGACLGNPSLAVNAWNLRPAD